MIKKPIKETIHAKGIDIAIYTDNFQDESISLTDIAGIKVMNPRMSLKIGCEVKK